MNNLSELIQQRIEKTSGKPEKKTNLYTKHQVEGVYYAKKLGASKPSEYAQIIRLVKLYPQIVSSAFSYVIDYPNAKSTLRLFFWKVNQLKVSNSRGLETDLT